MTASEAAEACRHPPPPVLGRGEGTAAACIPGAGSAARDGDPGLLDWDRLRPDPDRRAIFEELCCQLAAREEMPQGSRLARLDPPDGGVECLWRMPDGTSDALVSDPGERRLSVSEEAAPSDASAATVLHKGHLDAYVPLCRRRQHRGYATR